MSDFKTAYTKYIQPNEGGYSNVVGDKGGETYAGITRKNYSNWSGWSVIDAKKRLYSTGIIPRNSIFNELNSVTEQFYNDQWNKSRFGEIKNQDVANLLYDFFINSGPSAFKQIQKLVNVPIDGTMGNQTLTAINNSNAAQLYGSLKTARANFYATIVANDPSQSQFIKGWTNRLAKFPAFIKDNALPLGLIGILILVGATFWLANQSEPEKKKLSMIEHRSH